MAALSLQGFTDQGVVTGGLGQPISLAFLPDNRMLVLEKDGTIFIVNPETGEKSQYMELGNINSGQERGLLDIALDPDFDTNGHFYLFYTPSSPQNARVARFTHQENSGGLTSRGDLSSEMVVWEDTDGYISCCHYGGGLDFGPDGKLWLTSSDKFNTSTSGEGGPNDDLPVDLTSTSGKVIRINKDGSIPDGTDGSPANPYIDQTNDPNNEIPDSIWAYGLRNPFRASWDHQYGYFYIAEVGGNQSQKSSEDLHLASLDQPQVFYGWPYYEGTENTVVNDGASSPFDPADFPPPDGDLGDPANGDFYSGPIYSYPRAGGASITGGMVYRGDLFPDEWDGVYFYGDYARNEIRYVQLDATGTQVLGDFDFKPTAEIPGDVSNIVFLDEGEDGALYYISYSSNGGQVRRVIHGGNQSPVIVAAEVSETSGETPLTVIFTATVSDPDTALADLTYTITFGDGAQATGAPDPVTGEISAQHTYEADGLFLASLAVSDGQHATFSQPFEITAGDPNDAPEIANAMPDASFGDPGLEVTFTATVSDPDTALENLTYTITFGDGAQATGAPDPVTGEISVQHTYEDTGLYPAVLEVSDGESETRSAEMPIQIGPGTGVITEGLVLALESFVKVGLNGEVVTNWLDGSGLGNNLTAFGDPTLVDSATPGGQPAIVLDGEGDYLAREVSGTTPLSGFADLNGARSMFFVVDYGAPNGVFSGLAYGKGASDQAFGLTLNGNKGEFTVQGWGGNNDNPATNSDGVGPGFLSHAVVMQAGGTFDHYLNGSLIDSGSNNFQTVLERLVIGQEIARLGTSEMSVAAAFVYNRALSEQERQQVEGYIADTYLAPSGNQAPQAVADAFDGIEGQEVTGNLLVDNGNGADVDPDDGPAALSVVAETVATAEGGQAVLQANGDFSYTPAAGFVGSDSFDYTLSDGAATDTAAVTVTVAPSGGGNQAPQAVADAFDGIEGQEVTGNLLVDNGNGADVDPDDGPAALSVVAETVATAEGGQAVLQANGDFSYTPAAGFVGSDSFDYTLSDGAATDTAAVTVTVRGSSGNVPVTDGLVASYESDQNVTFAGGSTVNGWLDGSGNGNDLAGFGDPQLVDDATPQGQPAISFDGVGDKLERSGAQNLSTLPSGNAPRTMFFVVDYKQTNTFLGAAFGDGASNQAFGLAVNGSGGKLTVQGWGGGNDFPSSVNGIGNNDGSVGDDWFVQSVVYDGSTIIHYKDGAQIDSDTHSFATDLQKLVIGQEIKGLGFGNLDVAALLIYDRALTDQERQDVEAYLQVKFLQTPAANQAPQAVADAFDGIEGQEVTGNLLVDNGNGADVDPDDGPAALSVVAETVATAEGGQAVLQANGDFSYTPAAGFVGSDSFDYTLSDGAATDTAAVTVTVAPSGGGNQAPQAVADAFDGIEGQEVTGNLLVDNGNGADVDPDDGPAALSVVAETVATAEGGQAVLQANGDFSYTPAAGFVGSDSFDYTLSDGAATDTAAVTVTVRGSSGNVPVTDGLVASYESDQNVTFAGGSTVNGWLDGSGNGNDLAGFGDPQLVDDATPQGQPAISFDGVGDKLERSGAQNLSTLPSGNAPRTMFFVVDYKQTNTFLGAAFGDGASNQAFGLAVNGSGGKLTVQGWGGGNDFPSSVNGIGNNDGSVGDDWFVQSVVYDGSTIIHYKDGAQIDSDTHSFATDLQKLVIGQEIKGLGFGNLDVAALLIYDRALTDQERQDVEAYLQVKFLQTPAANQAVASAPVSEEEDTITADDVGATSTLSLADTDMNEPAPEDEIAEELTAPEDSDQTSGSGSTENLQSLAGGQQFDGGPSDDSLQSGSSHDELTDCGCSSEDTFYFKSEFGNVAISDFEAGPGPGNVIEFEGLGVSSFSELEQLFQEVDDGTLIKFDEENSILLQQVAVTELHADDFRFV